MYEAPVVCTLLEREHAQDLASAPNVVRMVVTRDQVIDLGQTQGLQVGQGLAALIQDTVVDKTVWPCGEIRITPSPCPTSM